MTAPETSALTAGRLAGPRADPFRPDEEVAQEMAERIRRQFGWDARFPAFVGWLGRCIGEARAEAVVTAQADAAAAGEERDALRRIVNIAWEIACDGYDYDGASIQEDMVAAGLATVRPMTDAEADARGYDRGGEWHEATPLGRRAMGWPATTAPGPDVSGRAGE